jgi:hypothetical protein
MNLDTGAEQIQSVQPEEATIYFMLTEVSLSGPFRQKSEATRQSLSHVKSWRGQSRRVFAKVIEIKGEVVESFTNAD